MAVSVGAAEPARTDRHAGELLSRRVAGSRRDRQGHGRPTASAAIRRSLAVLLPEECSNSYRLRLRRCKVRWATFAAPRTARTLRDSLRRRRGWGARYRMPLHDTAL